MSKGIARLVAVTILFVSSTASGQSRARRFGGLANYDADSAKYAPRVISGADVKQFFLSYAIRQKKQFETTDEYAAVVRAADDSFWYAFAVPTTGAAKCGHSISYDPDSEVVNVHLSLHEQVVAVHCQLADEGSYVGENGFGVKKTIQRYHALEFGFRYPKLGEYDDSADFSVPMPRAVAKKSLGKLRLAMIIGAQLTDNGKWAGRQDLSESPTLDSPVEIAGSRFFLTTMALQMVLYEEGSRRVIAAKAF